MIRIIPLALLLATAACANRPSPTEIVVAMSPLAYEAAAKELLARNDAKPFTEAQKAAIKAADLRAFDAVDRGLAAQWERVLATHRALQGL